MKNKIYLLLALAINIALYVSCDNSEESLAGPVILSNITPLAGQPGTLVKIRGKNFNKNASENIVTFTGIPAMVTQANDTLLEVIAPDSKSGVIEVNVRDNKVVGSEFKYYHLYTFGRSNNSPCFWKDGVQTTLGNLGNVNDLIVSGEDVHAVGFETSPAIINIPRYWKNGQPIPLDNMNPQTELTAITVSNDDVYICGYQRGPYPIYKIAKYWKNGTLIFSTQVYDFITAAPNDIAVIGSDVYMVGYEYPDAMLWKNGVPIRLEGTGVCAAEKILINDSDVHIVGVEGSGFYNRIRYWKNNTVMNFTQAAGGYAYDISIHNSDVYISGFAYGLQMGTTDAKYWVNGDVGKIMQPSSPNRYVGAIEVTDDAIYVLNNQRGESYPYYSILTKNDQIITPDYGPGVLGSIKGMEIVYY